MIAKAGKPLVKVSAIDAPAKPKRMGFLKGEIEVPCDFDRMGEREIAALFAWGEAWHAKACRPMQPPALPTALPGD